MFFFCFRLLYYLFGALVDFLLFYYDYYLIFSNEINKLIVIALASTVLVTLLILLVARVGSKAKKM